MYTATVQITDVTFGATAAPDMSSATNALVVSAHLSSLAASPAAENVFHLITDTGSPAIIAFSPSTGDDDIIQLTFQLFGDVNHTLIGIADLQPPFYTTGSDTGRSQFPDIAIRRDQQGSQLTLTDRLSANFNWDLKLMIQRVSDNQFGLLTYVHPISDSF